MEKLRNTLLVALLLLYLVPLLVITSQSSTISMIVGVTVWSFLGYGVMTRLIFQQEKNTLLLINKHRKSDLKKNPKTKLPAQTIINPETMKELIKELEGKNQKEKELDQEMAMLKEHLKERELEFAAFSQELQDQIDQKETSLTEYRDTCAQQREIIEKRQGDIGTLQGRINDLTYEVKTLLKLKESLDQREALLETDLAFGQGESFIEDRVEKKTDYTMVQVGDPAETQLEKCLVIAGKLTGANHLAGKRSNFSKLSLGSMIIDQRRLFEHYQSINHAVVLIYSPKEDRLIFVNRSIKRLLGWSADKFVKNFDSLVQQGMDDWQSALKESKQELVKSVRLLIKMRSGKDTLTYCHLGEVKEGNFKGYILGILETV